MEDERGRRGRGGSGACVVFKMRAEGRILLVIVLLLFVIGVWDAIAVSRYVGSLARLLAEGEGFDRAPVSFYPPERGTILICYEMSVEPIPYHGAGGLGWK
ncbi:MAG: hypothetical protein ACXQTZ_01795 [Candidatus Alkanophagales archaeon]